MRAGVKVVLTDKSTRVYTNARENERYAAKVEASGALTVYRCVATAWDDLIFPEASFAPGQWLEWTNWRSE